MRVQYIVILYGTHAGEMNCEFGGGNDKRNQFRRLVGNSRHSSSPAATYLKQQQVIPVTAKHERFKNICKKKKITF